MPKVYKSQLVEQVYPQNASLTKVQLNDQPYLRRKQIYGIEVLNVGDMTLSPTNLTPLTNAQMKTAYLTLYLNDVGNPENVGEWIQQVPFSLMHRVQNAANDPFVRQMFELNGQVIYWEKCYVTFPVALVATSAPISILFNIYFK